MTVKCEAMVDVASSPQAPESKQALVVDDSSAKTIEFLRARLLAERAASKAARQEAQEIAEKVKDLHGRLETEIEHRKEAEAAMERVFTILKSKGLAGDGLVPASANLKDQSESGVPPLSDVKEASEDCENIPCHVVEPSINKEVPPSLNKDGSTEKGMVETRIHVTNESHSSNVEDGILPMVVNTVETCHDTRDAFPCNVLHVDQTESGKDFSLQNEAESHRCQVDDDKQVVHTDHSSPNCSPECKKDSRTACSIEQGQSITLKLKAMLHQIEEEVGALPEEQPLKYQLQGWMDHVTSVLDKGEEEGINGGLKIHSLDDSKKAGTNYPLKEATNLETKSVIHTKMPILLTKKGHADALNLDETGLHSVNQLNGITEEVDPKEELDKTLSIFPKDMLQQPNLPPSSNNYNGDYPSTMYPPTCVDPVQHSNMSHYRKPSCESLNGSNRAAYVLQDPPTRPLHPQMMQHVISHSSIANPPMFVDGHTSNGHYTGSESSYLVEAQSPKGSDVISVGDPAGKVGYAHGQWNEGYVHGQCNEAWYQGRVLGSRRQAGYREDDLKFQSEAWSQGRYFNHGNIPYERGPVISHNPFMHVRDAREFAMKSTARHPRGRPLSDATLSLVDDRNGRLGDILKVLDAARQHVNDVDQSLYTEEQLYGPPTPRVADARFNRGYWQYGDEAHQVPCEYRNNAWRSRARSSQAPIIHFPPSPTSEHGYSPFERHGGGHRRSSSVATNFMMSEWESCGHPRGEVELGNGITLYTD
eukprot:c18951_g2_i1 orf=253-2532(-)